jgi:hypothetical protein
MISQVCRIAALTVFLGLMTLEVRAQFQGDPRAPLPSTGRGSFGTFGGVDRFPPAPAAAPKPAIAQKFPELRAVKRPLRLMPPRRVIVLDAGARGDATLRRLHDERRRLIGALRAAREVRDQRAMMAAMSRLESLRQRHLRRMRAVGRIKQAAPGAPMSPVGVPAAGEEPVIPLPQLPQPSRK